MADLERYVESFRWVIRARWIVLLVAMAMVIGIEASTPGDARNTFAWGVVLLEACFNLGYVLVAQSRRLSRLFLPISFLVDASVISAWVVLSGGAVSLNLVYYTVILIAASLVLSPRLIAVLGLSVIVLFLVSMRISYGLHIAAQVPAQAMNPFWLLMESAPEETRRVVYVQQCIRWTLWMGLVTFISALLGQRITIQEERLRVKERHLDQQRRFLQLGELTGKMAHSLNTPLGIISMKLEMLLKKAKKNSPLQRELEGVLDNVQRAVNTVKEVLNYNRQNLSQIQEVAIPDIVRNVAEVVAPRMEKKKGRFILDLPEGIPPLQAYPEAVTQALLNLVENAIDALPEEGGGTVALEARFDPRAVRLSARDKRGDVKIIVRDNGKGISAKDLKDIFEPFYSTKEIGHGTGLGLPIVRRIMEEHGGRVLAERNIEGGMKFTLVFPIGVISAADTEHLPPDFFDR